MTRTALVTDAARGSSLAVVRSLGRAGWRVLTAEHRRFAPAARSRYTTVHIRHADPQAEPDAAATRLVTAAHDHGVDLVLPMTDDIALPLAAHRHELPTTTRLAIPSEPAIAATADKVRTFDAAHRLGVPMPATVVFTDRASVPTVAHELATATDVDEAVRAVRSFGWPVVVKPNRSQRYVPNRPLQRSEVSFARDEAELRRRLDGLDGAGEVLLQAYSPGEGHGVELLFDHGRPLAVFQHRRLREVPLSGGPSSFRESVPVDRRMYEHAVALLRDAAFDGLAMVEFKRGADGPVLMEINGRPWGSLALAVRAGVDFPARLAALHTIQMHALQIHTGPIDTDPMHTDQMHMSEAPATPFGLEPGDYRVGVTSRSLELELRWIMAVLRGRRPIVGEPPSRARALAVAARLLWPRDGYDTAAADDPMPFVIDLVRIAGRGVGAVRHP